MGVEYAVETVGLVKVYPGGVRALDGVDLRVPRGVAFGLFGHNGAGKTTLLSILIGLIRPTSGTARVLGVDVLSNSLEVRRRTRVVPERFGFYDNMSGLGNLVFLAMLDGFERAEAERRAAEALERVGLSEAARRKVGEYSRGMRQRLCIAQALLREGELYIFDEPTLGLDPDGAKMFRGLVSDLVKAGKTVIISTHLLQEVGGLCSHAAVIRKGRVLAQGSFDEVADAVRERRGYEYEVRVRGDAARLAEALKGEPSVVKVDASADRLRVLSKGRIDEEIAVAARRAGLEVLSLRLLPSDWGEVFEALHEVS